MYLPTNNLHSLDTWFGTPCYYQFGPLMAPEAPWHATYFFHIISISIIIICSTTFQSCSTRLRSGDCGGIWWKLILCHFQKNSLRWGHSSFVTWYVYWLAGSSHENIMVEGGWWWKTLMIFSCYRGPKMVRIKTYHIMTQSHSSLEPTILLIPSSNDFIHFFSSLNQYM